MKFDINKAFPYPVLRPGSDDFGEADFQTNPIFSISGEKINFENTFTMSCNEIKDEIKKGTAEYVSLVCCRDTYYRHFLSSSLESISHKFAIGVLRDEVRVQSYIVATKDITSFYSPDINSEFGKGPFNYVKGEVLAQVETQVSYLTRDTFSPVTSVFDLVKRDGMPNNEWHIEYDQDHINIVLSPKMKEVIDSARNDKKNQVILKNSIYFAAVMQSVQMLKESSSDFDDYKWSQIIKKKAHNIGCDLETTPTAICAQRLMKGPISYLSSYIFEETE